VIDSAVLARDSDVRTATLRRALGVVLSVVALTAAAVRPAAARPSAAHAAPAFAALPHLRATERPAAVPRAATALGSVRRANWTAGANVTQAVEESGGAVFLKGKV